MGTRADFYVGRGLDAEWLGSIAWDGYPNGVPKLLLTVSTEAEFRAAVAELKEQRDDFTDPSQGWPWPWPDSQTTDYAYAWDGQTVVSCFGRGWCTAAQIEEHAARLEELEDEDDAPELWVGEKTAVFPDMSSKANVAREGARSGLLIIKVPIG